MMKNYIQHIKQFNKSLKSYFCQQKNTSKKQQPIAPFISATEAHSLLNSEQNLVKFIDFRDYQSFKSQRIPQSIYWDRKLPSIPQFRHDYNIYGDIDSLAKKYEKGLKNLGINSEDYVIGYENPFQLTFQTELFYYFLRYLGHKNVAILQGGLQGWKANNFPILTDKDPLELAQKQGNFTSKDQYQNQFYVTMNQILQILDEDEETNTKIIDTRSQMEYKMSHIPNSLNIPFQDLLKMDGQTGFELKAPEEIQEILKEQQISSDNELIVYCQKGYRSSVLFTILQHMGYKNVKNYIGSFDEWSEDIDNPIED